MGEIFPRESYVANDKVCPFCDFNHQAAYCLHQTNDLMLLQAKYPYGGIDNHYLIVPRRHIVSVLEATKEEVSQLLDMHQKLAELYDNKPHTVYLRFGAGTIRHLHWHALPITINLPDVEALLKKS